MYAALLLPVLALSAVSNALATPRALNRRSGCGWTPGQKNGNDYTTTDLFLLRVEEADSNKTIGYLDAFSTGYAAIAGRDAASSGFIAPYYNGYGSLIFWAGSNGTDRAYNAENVNLSNASSILPVTTPIKGGDACGTAPVRTTPKYSNAGSCVFGGDDVDVHFRCPFPGTVNDTPNPCWPQTYFACMNTGLNGVSDQQSVIFFGNGTTAVPGNNCCKVDLVSECP